MDNTASTQFADLWALELPSDRQLLSTHMAYQDSIGGMSPLTDEGWFTMPPEFMTEGMSTPIEQNVRNTPPDTAGPSSPSFAPIVDLLAGPTDGVTSDSGLVQSDL